MPITRRAEKRMGEPSISVVIPCYNESKALPRTLLHLQPLREKGVEIVVSDDSSTDGSPELARPLADHVVDNPNEARGAAGSRNRGASRAGGQLLIFLDADILPHEPLRFMEEVRRRFLDPRLIAATARCQVNPEEASPADRLYHYLYNRLTWLLNLVKLGTAGGWCQIVRREAFEEIGGYDPRFVSGQDVDLFLRLARRGRTRLLNSLLVYESPRRYRQQGLLRTAVRWLLNGIWTCLLRRPFPFRYPLVR